MPCVGAVNADNKQFMKIFLNLTIFVFKLVYREVFWFVGIYITFMTLQRFLLIHQNNNASLFLMDIFLFYILIFLLYGNLMEKIRHDSTFDWLRSVGTSLNMIGLSLDACILIAMILPLCILMHVVHMLSTEHNSLLILLLLGFNFLTVSHLCYGESSKINFLRLIVVPMPILLPSLIFAQGYYEQLDSNNMVQPLLFGITLISCGVLTWKLVTKEL